MKTRLRIRSTTWLLALALLAPTTAGAEFTYSCETCPTSWGQLDPEFAACDEGRFQSPIAVSTGDARKRHLPRLRVDFDETSLEVERKGTNFEAFVESGSGMRVGREHFELVQFHFHSVSEHLVNGERSDLELHFVHRTDDGELAVLAVFVEEGRRNRELDRLLEVLPAVPGLPEGGTVGVASFDPERLLPDTRRSLRYRGSTTTPPCAGDVSSILLARPLRASQPQIEAIRSTLHEINDGFDNNRVLQVLNGRRIATDAHHRRGDDRDDD